MNSELDAERCRMTVVGPTSTLELVIPANIPLADVLPVMAEHLGESFAHEAAGRGAVLQRLGEPPLDEELSAAGLGLRDGDLLYLHPRDVPLPAFACDDLIDGVAVRLRQRPTRWTPALTRATLLTVAGACLATGLPALGLDGARLPRALGAAGLSLTLVAGAFALSRAAGQRVASLLVGWAGVPYAALAGFLAPGADDGRWICVPQVTAASAAATAAAVLAGLAVGSCGPALTVAAVVGGIATVGGLAALTLPLDGPAAAAAVVVVALVLSPHIPTAAFRLAGMRVPDLPTGLEDIQRDVEAVPDEVVIERGAAVDVHLGALHLALGLVCTVGLAVAGRGQGWAPAVLCGLVSALLLLRVRALAGRWQRWAMVFPACYGAAALAVEGAALLSAPVRGLVVPLVAGLAAGVFLRLASMPQTWRPRPYWGRTAEILETVLSLALVPVLLQVLGVFAAVRGLGG